ncbi:hypothetical protein CGRA01v4_10535 [Colletotrichum graminicola]|nr:hypothetical protein CGRA01v4_10535 [Colletotrichum graminicola]
MGSGWMLDGLRDAAAGHRPSSAAKVEK